MTGQWNVGALEKRLTAKRFLGWEAYFQLEPLGEEREDHRAALIAGMVFNMAVDVKNRKPYTEWLLKFKEVEAKKQPTKEQLAKKQLELLNIYARASAGVEVVESKDADQRAQAWMVGQVAKARAAMGGS